MQTNWIREWIEGKGIYYKKTWRQEYRIWSKEKLKISEMQKKLNTFFQAGVVDEEGNLIWNNDQ